MMTTTRAASVLVAAALLLAGCSADTEKSRADDADVAFAQAMIPHHEQAVEMAELVDDADASPEVRDLAARIEGAQAPEIEQMQGWLREWDAEEGGHGGHDMAGMMTGDEMTELADATGPRFDRLWLTMMIEHHQGAIEMAEDVTAEGEDRDVAALAREIARAQRAEITEMEGLLDE